MYLHPDIYKIVKTFCHLELLVLISNSTFTVTSLHFLWKILHTLVLTTCTVPFVFLKWTRNF